MVVVDASVPVTDQDLRILTNVEETGRALVIAFNKWDLTDDERRRYLNREIERDLVAFQWAPVVNISALTGRNVDKLSKAIEAAAEGWETRVSTGKLNAFLGRLAAAQPHPVRGGKQPRILFGTQAQNCRRRSCSSPAASSTLPMCVSSSVGSVRSLASPDRRSTLRFAPGRSTRTGPRPGSSMCSRPGSSSV